MKLTGPRSACLAALIALGVVAGGCRGRTGPAGSVDGIPADRPTRTHRERFGEVTLNLVELGRDDRPLLVILHGGPGLDHTYLRPWLDAFADRHHVVYVDLRGQGRSDPPPDANGYTVSAAALDVHNVIQSLGHGAPADVLAHDFGAAVAVELAESHAESVQRLVLVGPYRDVSQLRAMPERTRGALGETGANALRNLTTPQGTLRDPRAVEQLFRTLGTMWFHRIPSAAVYRRLARDVRYQGNADEHFLVNGAGWSALQLAAEVRASALVVSGDDDRTFTADESRVLADALPHGRFAAIENSGHLPFVEQPARFRDVVETFLRTDGHAP